MYFNMAITKQQQQRRLFIVLIALLSVNVLVAAVSATILIILINFIITHQEVLQRIIDFTLLMLDCERYNQLVELCLGNITTVTTGTLPPIQS